MLRQGVKFHTGRAADAAAAKAAIERTIKIEGRRRLHLGRGQVDHDAERRARWSST